LHAVDGASKETVARPRLLRCTNAKPRNATYTGGTHTIVLHMPMVRANPENAMVSGFEHVAIAAAAGYPFVTA